MQILLSLLSGYLLGSLSPSALIARIRGVDIRRSGTKNLGATNALINFGKGAGLLVMLFDIGKAYFSVSLAELLFPASPYAGLTAGCGAIAGHILPFYLRFRGGKGLASLGGLILAWDPELFFCLLGIGAALMIITDISIALQLTATLLFPPMAYLRSGSSFVLALCSAVCVLVLAAHRSNIAAALNGEDVRVREFARRHFPGRRP